MNELLNKINDYIVFFIVYSLLFYLGITTFQYVYPLVIAFVFSLLLIRPTKFLMDKLKIRRSISSLIATSLFFIILFLGFSKIILNLVQEIFQLGLNLQTYLVGNTTFINEWFDKLYKYYNNLDPAIISTIESNLTSSLKSISNAVMSISSSIITGFLSFFSSIPYILMVIIFTLIGTYYFTKEMSYIRAKTNSFVNKYEGEKFIFILREGKEMIGNYLWAYCLILLITFIVTLSGFTFLKVKYALTLSAIIAVFDLLPILGAFMVYIPLAIVYLISNNYFTAVGLVVLFLIITVTRQFIEPKIMSKSLDIHPLIMLTALFVGLRFGGVSGILFCTFIVIFYRILHKTGVL